MEEHSQRSYRFGTWNVCSLGNKKREVFSEIKRENEDVVVLTETKLRGCGEEEYGGYIHLFCGVKTGALRAGVSILLKKDLVRSYQWKYQHERLSRVDINICGQSIAVIGVYWVDECAQNSVKDAFQSRFESVLQSVEPDKEIIILGDFNSRVGISANSPVLGMHGDSEINSNGRKLISICEKYHLKIQNTFFYHEDKHKYTWYHRSNSRKTIIDFCITSQISCWCVEDVVACRWMACGTDHVFLEATLYLHCLNRVTQTPLQDIPFELRKYRTCMLYSKTIRTSYRHQLDNAIDLSVPRTTGEMYHCLKEKVHSAAYNILGLKQENRSDELLWDQEIWDLQALQNGRGNRLKSQQLSSEMNFSDDQFNIIKNQVWKGICSRIENTEESKRVKVIWNIVRDLQNRRFWIYYNKDLLVYIIRKHMESKFHQQSDDYIEYPYYCNMIVVDVNDVRRALFELDDCNSLLPGGLEIILLRHSGRKAIMLLRNIIQNIFDGQSVPKEITEVYPCCNIKEDCARHYGEYSIHIIIRVMRKVLEIILEHYISFKYINQDIPCTAYHNVVFTLRQILQKRAQKQIPSNHLIFTDLKRTSLRFDLSKFFEIISRHGLPRYLVKIIKNLYSKNIFRFFSKDQTFENVSSVNGLTYDDSLSCILFKIYLKEAIKEWHEENLKYGAEIKDKRLLSFFLDDCKLVILSNTAENMQTIIRSLKQHLESVGMELDLQDLKYLGDGILEIEKERIPGKDMVNFHDLILQLDGGNSEEVCQHILDAKEAIGTLHTVARDETITNRNKKRIFHSIIMRLLLQNGETWIVTKEESFEAVEVRYWRWCYEKYPQRYTKEEIYHLIDAKDRIFHALKKKKADWYERITQARNWTKLILEWEPEGKLKPGKPRKKWDDGIKKFIESEKFYT